MMVSDNLFYLGIVYSNVVSEVYKGVEIVDFRVALPYFLYTWTIYEIWIMGLDAALTPQKLFTAHAFRNVRCLDSLRKV